MSYELDPASASVLHRLLTTASRARLVAELELSEAGLELALSKLEERGLVFRDGEHLLGLPHPERTAGYPVRSWPLEAMIAAFKRNQQTPPPA